MKVFYSDRHGLHAPRWYVADGTVRPCPEAGERADRIRLSLSALPGMDLHLGAATDPWPAIRSVHDAHYLAYLETIHAAWTAEFSSGHEQGAPDVIPDTFVRRPAMKMPTKPSAQAGYFCFDTAAPITAGTWQAAIGSAHCATDAAQAILNGDRAAYALCRPPGHHAGADYCGGFCYLNNAAIAAQHMLLARSTFQKIAILDVDYHHGNGTQDIFYGRRDVFFASLHADPHVQYPYFWGHADETGTGAGTGFTANFPLPRGTPAATWFQTLESALERIARYAPQALIVSLGVDTFTDDGVGDFGLSLEDFGNLGRRLSMLHETPLLFVQEGGYNLDAIGPCVAEVLSPIKC